MENNSLGKKMESYKLEIRKAEYKKKFSETRKRFLENTKNPKITEKISQMDPEKVLLTFEKEISDSIKKENPEKLKETFQKLNNYISIFKEIENEVFPIFINKTKIFEEMKKILELENKNFFEKEKKEIYIKILHILGNICVSDYEDIKILLEKGLLDFFLKILKNEKIGMKEILWNLANLCDNEDFVFYYITKYTDLLEKTFNFFEENENNDKIHNLFAWYFSQLLKNSINNEKIINKILTYISILGKDRYNYDLQKEILYGIFIFLNKKVKTLKLIIREDIKKMEKLHITNLIVYSLESENFIIKFSALKILNLFSYYEKNIADLYYNNLVRDSLIDFLESEKIKIRYFAISTILNFLLTDEIFLERFLIKNFFDKFFFILENDGSSKNICKCLKLLNILFINNNINVTYIDKIIN